MSWIDDQPADKIDAALVKYRADTSIWSQDPRSDSNGDERYGLWLMLVNVKMMRLVGIGYHDIEDWTWADAYEDGMSPSEAVREALANAGLVDA